MSVVMMILLAYALWAQVNSSHGCDYRLQSRGYRLRITVHGALQSTMNFDSPSDLIGSPRGCIPEISIKLGGGACRLKLPSRNTSPPNTH
jgi:hypothetical protein